NTYFKTKAEQYSLAVAAASILARASFLKKMDELSIELGIKLPKGASQQVDQTIATIIKTRGKSALYGVAKLHFANTKKANKYLFRIHRILLFIIFVRFICFFRLRANLFASPYL